ncbi:Hypothetical protein A7982_05679 [Minicystis rosea]|nr:Hypothetical protein A7982_05679 [Minicystis rosea]
MVALIAAAPSAARAQSGPEPVRFAWVRAEGADGCTGQQQIAARVSARLGKSPFSADAARSIEAIVSRAEHGFRAGIYVRGQDGALVGARELTSEAADCASIEAASVLAIALAIDPEASLRAPPPPPSSPGGRPPVATSLPSAPPVPSSPEPFVKDAPSPLSPPLPAALPVIAPTGLGGSGLTLRGGAGLGLVPAPAPIASLSGHVALARSVQLTAEAMWMPETRTADGRFGFGLAAFSLGACFVAVRSAAVDLSACAAVWGGALHAVVRELEPAEPGDYAWVAASAAPRLRIRLAARLFLELGTHVVVPITRRPFVVSGWMDPVFRQAPVTAAPFAGIGVSFP